MIEWAFSAKSWTTPRHLLLAIFSVSAAVLLFEISVTRIYSVILYYHFAFMVVSLAMFGLTAGGVLTMLDGSPRDPIPEMARCSAQMGILVVVCVLAQLCIPYGWIAKQSSSAYIFLSFLLCALPFIPAGRFICLALTRFPRTGTLYSADLIGAAIGCALAPWALSQLGGPGAMFSAAAPAFFGAFLLFRESRRRVAAICLALAAGVWVFALANRDAGWVRVSWRRGGPTPKPIYERWNAFSRIAIWQGQSKPFGWGIDPDIRKTLPPIEQLRLEIDAGASTPLTRFHGDLRQLGYLRYDITSFAHYLRPGAETLVIGSGGGRDVLAALAFRQPRVLGLEVNPEILAAVNGAFGEFTGHLDRLPHVEFQAREARSYLATHDRRFGIIQASLVDTAAATGAGAYAFVENGLYTVEAWRLFLSRLQPGGVLSFSRWYYGVAPWPVETCRLVALAAAALRSSGVADPLPHLLLVRMAAVSRQEGVATLLVSRDPFTPEDRSRAQEVCRALNFDMVLGASEAAEPFFVAVAKLPPATLRRIFPLDVSPPTDNRPYFFFHARLSDLFRAGPGFGASSFNLEAVRVLGLLAALTVGLGLGLVLMPLFNSARRAAPPVPLKDRPLMPLYFGMIGSAFMFVEVGLIQRLTIFLGHPTYAFTVVLFGMLVFSGIGSLLSERLGRRVAVRRQWWLLVPLVPLLIGMEASSWVALQQGMGLPSSARISLALGAVGLPALFMGFAFPLAMSLAKDLQDADGAWYWAINGAFSIIASAMAMICSLSFGTFATLWCGTALYAVAILLYRSYARQNG